MAGPYNIPTDMQPGDPGQIEWAADVGAAVNDLNLRANALESGGYVGVNAQSGTTYTPVLADQGKLVTLTNAGAISVTLPDDGDLAFPVGGTIDFAVLGAGMATFVAGTGAAANGTPSLVTRAQYSAATAIKVAADSWLVVGDLA